MKKFLIIITVIILIIAGAILWGCERMGYFNGMHFTEEEFQIIAEEYLQEKYGDLEFDIDPTWIFVPKLNIGMYSLSVDTVIHGMDVHFFVRMHVREFNYENNVPTSKWLDEPYVEDDFMGYFLYDEYEDMISDYASKYFDNFKIFVEHSRIFTGEMKLEDVTLDRYLEGIETLSENYSKRIERLGYNSHLPNVYILYNDESVTEEEFYKVLSVEFFDYMKTTGEQFRIEVDLVDKENFSFDTHEESLDFNSEEIY